MNIPPKYEDVVAQLEISQRHLDRMIEHSDGLKCDLESSLGREAALREEFDSYKIKRTEFAHRVGDLTEKSEQIIDALQQRLTVAEQRIVVLTEALEGMIEYFPEGHSDGECFSVERANLSLGRSNDCIHDWFPDYCLKCGITKP